MSLFQCDKCGVRENTACTFGYVGHSIKEGRWAQSRLDKGLKVGGKYCSECWDGKWHGFFPKEFYPLGSMYTDTSGNLQPRNPSPAASMPQDATETEAARNKK